MGKMTPGVQCGTYYGTYYTYLSIYLSGMLRYNSVLGMAPWGIVVLTALVVGAAHAYGRMTAEDPGACRLVLRGSV